ncbi:MAG TPA: PA14 domain-containing protein [Candidatus Binataceae bacterium]|nr:PA14 domain-containing protein [Candidatus Binataceae bacterium]
MPLGGTILNSLSTPQRCYVPSPCVVLASLGIALTLLSAVASVSFAADPAPVAQGQQQITIPSPPPSGGGAATLEIQPSGQKRTVSDDALSRKATAYLHHHRLPYVNAQVFADAYGTVESIVLTGQVRTAFGKQDAEGKARLALGVSDVAISNQIQVGDAVTGKPILETQQSGCATTAFGSTCQPSNPSGKAHAFLYRLTPIPNPQGFNGQSGTVNLMNAGNRIRNLEFYTNEINVPDREWTLGFPGYPQINQWFGVCYDGGFNVPTADSYTIVTIADDGVAMWIDNRLVNDNEDFIGNHIVGVGHEDIESRPYFTGGDGGEVGVASNPIYLSAGLHGVIVKYWQGWPSYLGVQVWAIPSSRFSKGRGMPSNADLMQLVGPPDGILKCPH